MRRITRSFDFLNPGRRLTILLVIGYLAVASFDRPAAADEYQVRVHVLGIVGHRGYETITRPIAGATITTTDPLTPKTITDKNGWATIATRSCEVVVAAAGFEPTRQAPPADIGPNFCEQSIEVQLMSTALLMDPKLRRYVDVRVYDAKTLRALSGVSVACVLYYDGAGKPRLATPRLTDARGRARVEAYFRLHLDTNLWWQPMDRIDLAASKPGYAAEIDTLVESSASRSANPSEAEIAMERL